MPSKKKQQHPQAAQSKPTVPVRSAQQDDTPSPVPPPLPIFEQKAGPPPPPSAATAAAAQSTSPASSVLPARVFSSRARRYVAWWTVMWFLCAASAAALLIAAELFQDYRPAFPLEPACGLGSGLHILAGAIVVRIGVIRHAPHFSAFQPFAGGITFVLTQIVAYTLYGTAILTLYLYFLAPAAVPARGSLAAAGVMSGLSSWFQFMSLQYYRAERGGAGGRGGAKQQGAAAVSPTTPKTSVSRPMNEARAGAVMILVQAVLVGAAQWHHERGIEDVARATGFLLLVAHVLTAFVCHYALGARHVPNFRWFMPFSGRVADIVTQAVSWAGFACAVLGFRVMLEPGTSASRGGIGWGFFGAVGTAANIGLLIQMRARVREHREAERRREQEKQQLREGKLLHRSASTRSLSPISGRSLSSSSLGGGASSSSSSAAAHFFARSSRSVLTMMSILIAIYSAAVDEPYIMELITAYTAADMWQWRLSNTVLLHCSVSFPIVTHITGVVLRAYIVRNPFASRLAGTEFVALQLLGWASFVSAFMFGVVTRNLIAAPWTAALALLAQLLISSSVSLVEMKTQDRGDDDDGANAAVSGENSDMSDADALGVLTSPLGDTPSKTPSPSSLDSPNASPLRRALARMPMRGLDEIFNGVFLTGLVGSVVSILFRVGCDFAVSFQQQRIRENTTTNNDNKNSNATATNTTAAAGTSAETTEALPFFVVVAASTLLWAFCVPMLQFSIGGVLMRPFQGPPLYAALQALGWTSYIFILVLLSLVSVDVAAATTATGETDFARYHPFQFTSQGALMLIPVFLVTVSAFFSNELDPQQQQQQQQEQASGGGQATPFAAESSPDQMKQQNQPQQQHKSIMSAEELQLLKKMRASVQSSAHPNLAAALDQLLVASVSPHHHQQTFGRTPVKMQQYQEQQQQQQPTVMSRIQSSSLKPGIGGGDAIAAGIVVVCCLAIASLALFVAAEHMGRDAPRPLHVGILGVAALAASAMGSLAAHARIGPALHGAGTYRWWMPFQGGAAFVTWQFVGFGTMASSLLLFLVDVLRRRQMDQQLQLQPSQQNPTAAAGMTLLFGGTSSLVPSGLLGGLAPVLVLCSTFTFDKSRTALDQRGSVIYDNAEALLVFVVLGASYLLAATSELWLRNDWELATIPLLMGSCAALFTMPVAVIAIRKAADLQKFRSGDTVEALDQLEYEESRRRRRSSSSGGGSGLSSISAAAAVATASANKKRKKNTNKGPTQATADNDENEEEEEDDEDEEFVVDVTAMSPSRAAVVSLKTALVGAPLVLVECVVLAICGAIPLSLVYGSYHLYHNYFIALPAIVKTYQMVVIALQGIFLALFWWMGMLQWATATASAFLTYSMPIFLGGFVVLFPAFRPHALGAWWFLVELVLGMVPPYWIQPVLTLHDCIMMTACSWQALKIFNAGGPIGFRAVFSTADFFLRTVAPVVGLEDFAQRLLLDGGLVSASLPPYVRWYNTLAASSAGSPEFSLLDAMGRIMSGGSGGGNFSSSEDGAVLNNSTSAAGAAAAGSIPSYMALFGSTCSLQLENAFLFMLLILYKFRYLRSPEETGRCTFPLVQRLVKAILVPGLERFFSMRLIVSDDGTDLRPAEKRKAKLLDKRNFKSWHLDAKNKPENVIFGWHPHGIFAFTVPWLTMSEAWRRAAGGALPRDVVPFAANVIFNVPVMRDWSMWLGARAATRTAIVHTVSSHPGKKMPAGGATTAPGGGGEKKSAMIVPGGQAELIENEINPKVMRMIGYHLGFIRIAVQRRVPPCPIMGFGENNILDNIHMPAMQKFFLRKFQFPFPILPLGFMYTWLPRRVPVTPVVGRPVDIEAVWRNVVAPTVSLDSGAAAPEWPAPNSSEEKLLVDAVAECYYEELTRIFYAHREMAGFSGTDLFLIPSRK